MTVLGVPAAMIGAVLPLLIRSASEGSTNWGNRWAAPDLEHDRGRAGGIAHRLCYHAEAWAS